MLSKIFQEVPKNKSNSSIECLSQLLGTPKNKRNLSVNLIELDQDNQSTQESLSPIEEFNQFKQDNFKKQFINKSSIYDAEMSNTRIVKAYDQFKRKSVILKYIDKNGFSQDEQQQALAECKLQCQFDHYNLVKGFSYDKNLNENIIIMEYVNDGDYFVRKLETKHTPIKNEVKLKSYIIDVLHGLQYVHQKNYVHCDIKAANLLCHVDDDKVKRVKIADLGLIHKIDPKTNTAFIEKKCGTFGYIAPEVKNKSYVTTAVDMWSLGIVLYQMCVAYLPHHFKKPTKNSYVQYREVDWKNKSSELKNFIQGLLQQNPSERMTIDQAFEHPWLN